MVQNNLSTTTFKGVSKNFRDFGSRMYYNDSLSRFNRSNLHTATFVMHN